MDEESSLELAFGCASLLSRKSRSTFLAPRRSHATDPAFAGMTGGRESHLNQSTAR